MACRLLLGASLGWIGCIVIDDVAMGGRSHSTIDTASSGPGMIHWAGTLLPSSTGKSGVFSSFHCPLGPERLEHLGDAEQFVFNVSAGWGKRFALRASVNERASESDLNSDVGYYSPPFATVTNGTSITVSVHIDTMEPRRHGRVVLGAPKLTPKDVVALGFVIVGHGTTPEAGTHGQLGPFELDVAWVAAVDGPSPPTYDHVGPVGR